ncbi:MAG: hypothetical protein FWD13_04785 [Treponema sp.]|nr:hypothetical protein [Treponema sp.]
MKDRLSRCIYESAEKDRCDFYDALVVNKIFKAFETAGNKQELWLMVLIKILGRIKNEKQSTPDPANKDGRKVFLPIDHKKCMAIFFKNQPERRYLIYNFIITDR